MAGTGAPTGWLVTDGKVGIVNQCLGLAEALGLDVAQKVMDVRVPWRWLPARWWPWPLAAQRAGADSLAPPWPDVIIVCGRRAFAPVAEIRRRSAGRTIAIAVQNPVMDPARFDLVVAPAHDGLSGPNVVVTEGAPHRVTRARLEAAAARFGAALEGLPRPRVAVLIGGSTPRYRFDEPRAEALAAQLAGLVERHGAGLMVTTSRRTPGVVVAALQRALTGKPAALWTGTGDNPYFAYLALADAVVATPDSVSMISEAAFTGRPIYVVDMPGGGGRNAVFLDRMARLGVTRPFAGRLEAPWAYPAMDVTGSAAAEIRARLGARLPQNPNM